ncbi:MAG: hypothetical protein IKU02_06615 [Bacteroidaceae bacterium]|nr:hypothetical protein [Bacteroidaceae bacterium]
MESLKFYFKKVLSVICKAGDGLSYFWPILPIASVLVNVKLFKIMEVDPYKTNTYCGYSLLIFLLYIIATLFLLHRDKIVQFCFAVAVGFILFLFDGFIGLALQSAPTCFAMEHSVPEGLPHYTPKAEKTDLSEDVDSLDETTYLQVRNSFQGGIYEYSFYYPKLPEGIIYLKCYEVTENLPLSESRLARASCQQTNGTDHFACLVDGKQFTIYEGDWGKYYAARIEVWFMDKKGNERKLLEKIYAVEGWMR